MTQQYLGNQDNATQVLETYTDPLIGRAHSNVKTPIFYWWMMITLILLAGIVVANFSRWSYRFVQIKAKREARRKRARQRGTRGGRRAIRYSGSRTTIHDEAVELCRRGWRDYQSKLHIAHRLRQIAEQEGVGVYDQSLTNIIRILRIGQYPSDEKCIHCPSCKVSDCTRCVDCKRCKLDPALRGLSLADIQLIVEDALECCDDIIEDADEEFRLTVHEAARNRDLIDNQVSWGSWRKWRRRLYADVSFALGFSLAAPRS